MDVGTVLILVIFQLVLAEYDVFLELTCATYHVISIALRRWHGGIFPKEKKGNPQRGPSE